MKKELDDKLCEDFPLLYADRRKSMQETCMCWGFPGDGWEPLIRKLSEKLEPLIQKWCRENVDKFDQHARASQVKEKFGTLRFYMDGYTTKEMNELIREAELKSEETCEDCGAVGIVFSDGWIRTLCLDCEKKRQEKKERILRK